MLKKLSLVALTLLYMPIGIGIGICKGVIAALRGKMLPLNEVIEKSVSFLRPQVSIIAERYENKYAVITWESIAYALAVGEEIAGRPVLDEEFRSYLIGVFGNDYEMRIDRLLYSVKNTHGTSGLRKIKVNLQKIAKDDVRSGSMHCSKFLLSNAKLYDDDMQLKLSQMAAADVQ